MVFSCASATKARMVLSKPASLAFGLARSLFVCFLLVHGCLSVCVLVFCCFLFVALLLPFVGRRSFAAFRGAVLHLARALGVVGLARGHRGGHLGDARVLVVVFIVLCCLVCFMCIYIYIYIYREREREIRERERKIDACIYIYIYIYIHIHT